MEEMDPSAGISILVKNTTDFAEISLASSKYKNFIYCSNIIKNNYHSNISQQKYPLSVINV